MPRATAVPGADRRNVTGSPLARPRRRSVVTLPSSSTDRRVRRHVRQRRMRIVLVSIGLLSGVLMTVLTRPTGGHVGLLGLGMSGQLMLAVIVHAAYGALAGWAITALFANLVGER